MTTDHERLEAIQQLLDEDATGLFERFLGKSSVDMEQFKQFIGLKVQESKRQGKRSEYSASAAARDHGEWAGVDGGASDQSADADYSQRTAERAAAHSSTLPPRATRGEAGHQSRAALILQNARQKCEALGLPSLGTLISSARPLPDAARMDKVTAFVESLDDSKHWHERSPESEWGEVAQGIAREFYLGVYRDWFTGTGEARPTKWDVNKAAEELAVRLPELMGGSASSGGTGKLEHVKIPATMDWDKHERQPSNPLPHGLQASQASSEMMPLTFYLPGDRSAEVVPFVPKLFNG